MEIKKTKEEIEALIDRAAEERGIRHAMTYEEGVRYALEWVLGKENGYDGLNPLD